MGCLLIGLHFLHRLRTWRKQRSYHIHPSQKHIKPKPPTNSPTIISVDNMAWTSAGRYGRWFWYLNELMLHSARAISGGTAANRTDAIVAHLPVRAFLDANVILIGRHVERSLYSADSVELFVWKMRCEASFLYTTPSQGCCLPHCLLSHGHAIHYATEIDRPSK